MAGARRGHSLDKWPWRCNYLRMPHPLRHLAPSLAALGLALACGGKPDASGARAVSARCTPASDTLVRRAVLEYVKLASPSPQRFLVAAGTDSALPEPGLRALQDKGPTYFYPTDSVQRIKLQAKLADVGGYATLLVSYKGMQRPDGAHASVRLRGTYVGGEANGLAGAPRLMRLSCDSAGWHFDGPAEDR